MTETRHRAGPTSPAIACRVATARIAELDLRRHAGTALQIQAAALATVGNPEVDPSRAEIYVYHATQPRFRAFGAWDADRLVGFTYGHLVAPGQWWHGQVAPALRERRLDGWLASTYVLVELHVLPERHGQGIGPDLVRALVGPVAERRLLLSTDDLDTPARRLYRRLGFQDLLTGFRFSSTARPFAIMGAPLPLPPGWAADR